MRLASEAGDDELVYVGLSQGSGAGRGDSRTSPRGDDDAR